MFKKTNNFNEKLYGVFDNVSGHFSFFFSAYNDGLACRKAMLSLAVPLRDTQLYLLGSVEGNFVKSSKPVLVSWDSYRLPENVAEALDPLHCSPDELMQVAENFNKKSEVNNAK